MYVIFWVVYGFGLTGWVDGCLDCLDDWVDGWNDDGCCMMKMVDGERDYGMGDMFRRQDGIPLG